MANDAFKALAHPLRRDIVEWLSGEVATVGEVTRDFGVSKPTISRHLKMLEEAGVVSRVIDGRIHRLTLPAGGTCRGLGFGQKASGSAESASSMSSASTWRNGRSDGDRRDRPRGAFERTGSVDPTMDPARVSRTGGR